MDIDYERWLNELRHKYLAIIHQAYSICWKTNTLSELESTYDMIMYGPVPPEFDDSGKQLPRKRSNSYLTSSWLTRFALLIESAKEELDEFMSAK